MRDSFSTIIYIESEDGLSLFLPTVLLVGLVALIPKGTPELDGELEPVKRRHICTAFDKWWRLPRGSACFYFHCFYRI